MAKAIKNLKTCKSGHLYYKTSDCPTCPICENERKPKNGFLSLMSAPARRALERERITTLKDLAKYTESELLKFHGMGPASIPRLRKALKEIGADLKK